MLLPMPIFLALYWVLLEAVELRHAPFILWIEDLAVMDPYFVLPILMAGSMYFMQTLNPQIGDPMQIKMMKAMPLVFGLIMLWFPAGLVLYWLVNNFTFHSPAVVRYPTNRKRSGCQQILRWTPFLVTGIQ